jgi:hypothetical protein
MGRVLIAALCLITIAGCTAQSSEAVSVESSLARQDEEARRFIEFDRIIASIDARAGVAAAWPDLRQFFPPDERDWESYRDEVNFTDVAGLIERLYMYRKGAAQITIDVFVSSSGPQPAVQRLIDTLVSTSIGFRRFERGPTDIGQLCLVLPLPNATLLVINRNVFVRIRRTNHSMDLVPMARSLTAFMNANVVPAIVGRRPTFAQISLKPESPAVNSSATVSLQLPADFPAADLMWTTSPDLDTDVVEKRDQGPDSAELRLRRAGRVEVPLWLADRRTLLSSESRLAIDVRP